jgi:hypothetical protein
MSMTWKFLGYPEQIPTVLLCVRNGVDPNGVVDFLESGISLETDFDPFLQMSGFAYAFLNFCEVCL